MKKTVWQEISAPFGLIVLFAVAIFGVMGMTNNLKNPPSLSVDNPKTVTTNEEKLIISGQADPKATLKIGNDKVTIEKNGNFSYSAKLTEGEQKIKVIATKWYVQRTETLTVTRVMTTINNDTAQAPQEPAGQVAQPTVNTKVTNSTDTSLSASGPKENIIGAFGFTLFLISFHYFRKSRKSIPKTAYKAFTSS